MNPNDQDPDVRETMQPLERLDLSVVKTVSQLVDAMRKCSFGARMLGNVADTITNWCKDTANRPVIIYDGPPGTTLHRTATMMMVDTFFRGLHSSELFMKIGGHPEQTKALVLGVPDPRYLPLLKAKCHNLVFVNEYGMCSPGQYGDGYFPNMVVSDPLFVVAVLHAVLQERLRAHPYTVSGLMEEIANFPDLAGDVFKAARTLHKMVHDPECTVFLTLAGAMTVAKMGLLIDDMIRLGMVDYVASTGALMAHGLIEGTGLKHYAYDPKFNDELLAKQGLNRVTDALEPEENFDHIDKIVSEVLATFDGSRPVAPSEFHAALGMYLAKHHPNERAILKSAYQQDVPIVIPAFTDSEIGNDVFVHRLYSRRHGKRELVFDQERDTELLLHTATRAKKLGIFTIGGGVPRNNTQNVAPLIEIANNRLDLELPTSMFSYAVRIDPTPLFYGNLSGCTYSEGGSWRKFDLHGDLTEVRADATIVWPFILKHVLDSFQGRDRWKIQHRPERALDPQAAVQP